MHSYDSIREQHGNRVSQTIDSPITIFDYWELSDGFLAMAIIMVFGVMFNEWWTMIVLLVAVLGIGPTIRRKNEKGVWLHYPYRTLRMSLPGLVNPRGRRTYSD